MRVSFLGGASEVGASSTLIEIAGVRLLVDAGIRMSPRSSRGLVGGQLPHFAAVSDVGGPDFIIVTHAHTDHTGALPVIAESFPGAPILMSAATQGVMNVLHADALRLMDARLQADGELPHFDEAALAVMHRAIQPVAWRQPLDVGDGVRVSFFPSGHILGAAGVLIESVEGSVFVTGDYSLGAQRAVGVAEAPSTGVDLVISESTYGGRAHAERATEERRIVANLARVTERGGKVLIPAFGVGRGQELIQILHAFASELKVPVFVDGMVRGVSGVYAAHASELPSASVRAAGEEHLFWRGAVRQVKSQDERYEVLTREEPCVIIASSGMLSGGASPTYAAGLAPDPRNAIFLTGYQDEESPGRALQRLNDQRGGSVTLAGKRVTLNAEVGTYNLSAHADEGEMTAYVSSLKPAHVALVHGDDAARESLRARLARRKSVVHTPTTGSVLELEGTRRVWAVSARVRDVTTPEALVPSLWEAMAHRRGSYVGVRELAMVAFGDPERGEELRALLLAEGAHFTPHWAGPMFLVRSAENIGVSLERRRIMRQQRERHGEPVGQLVALADARGAFGVVLEARGEEYRVRIGSNRSKTLTPDRIGWFLGPTDATLDLNAFRQRVEACSERAYPSATRLAVNQREGLIDPRELLPETLPDGVERIEALAAITRALLDDGARPTHAGLTLTPNTAAQPLEMNAARNAALRAFRDEADLAKVSLTPSTHELTLRFHYPSAASERHRDRIALLERQTRWRVRVHPHINAAALPSAITPLLPAGVRLRGAPSLDASAGVVTVTLEREDGAGLGAVMLDEVAFAARTGLRLVVRGAAGEGGAVAVGEGGDRLGGEGGGRMEQNEALAFARSVLPEGARVGVKAGALVVSFMTPGVARHHHAALERVRGVTGFEVQVGKRVDQEGVMAFARALMERLGVGVSRVGWSPSAGRVLVRVAAGADAAALLEAERVLVDALGVGLQVEAAA